MYFLIDTNVAAGYYLPRTIKTDKTRKRIELIINHIRSNGEKHFIYIPNICIAETFNVFYKYSYSKWNPHLKGKGTIDKRIFSQLVKSFHNDIHNAKFMYHYELNRYHILGINLVAPIDHYFQISKSTRNTRIVPMGTFDQIIISMGIHLAHIHGRNNVCILTTDKRMSDILEKCKSDIPANTIRKLKLNIAKEVAGKPFSKELFPKHLNLNTCNNEKLKSIFHEWPPRIGKYKKTYRYLK